MRSVSKVIFLLVFAVSAVSCVKSLDDESSVLSQMPTNTNNEISLKNTSRYVSLTATIDQPSRVKTAGFYVSKSHSMESAERIVTATDSKISFNYLPDSYGTEYYYCSFISNGQTERLSSIKNFKTYGFGEYVSITTPTVESMTATTAIIKSEITVAEGIDAEFGICYGAENNPTIDGAHIISTSSAITAEIPCVSKCYVRSYAKEGNNVAYSSSVQVVQVTKIELDETAFSLEVGQTKTLTATVSPAEATNMTVKWESSDPTVATVTDDGIVTGQSLGTATITAKCGTKSVECVVTVVPTPVESVTLNKSSLDLEKGSSYTLEATVLPATATDKSITWTSSATNVATVANGIVKGVSLGTAVITATSSNGKMARCTVTVTKPMINGFEYVDLGLSVKWATCNIGASRPEEYGRYFAWGDVTGQTWNGSSWSGSGFSTYPSYSLDANNNLKPEYDAAHVKLGGTWRMPTKAEFAELISNCTCTWTTNYNSTGVAGRIFTSKKSGYTDRSIFLPAAGYGYYSYFDFAGPRGRYWSSTFNDDGDAWYLFFYSDYVITSYSDRYRGLSVRPVSE